MLKVVREAKQESSWIDPDSTYESAVLEFTRAITEDGEVAEIVAPLAADLATYGYRNGLSQLVLKLTTPGVPDIYQGTELMDLSLVDPDNRRPVDFARREALLGELASLPTSNADLLQGWLQAREPRLKMLLLHRLLSFRGDHEELFGGTYRALEPGHEGPNGQLAEHLIGFCREGGEEQLLVLVPRFFAVLKRRASAWGEASLPLPADLHGGGWQEVVTGSPVEIGEALAIAQLPLLPAVLYRSRPKGAAGAGGET
jgi:(1->4)-alpha-D-glucan 1-alpha-D-glucosylmutase